MPNTTKQGKHHESRTQSFESILDRGVNNDTILDLASNPLNEGFTSGETYIVNETLTFQSNGAQDGWVLESAETSGIGGSFNPTRHCYI